MIETLMKQLYFRGLRRRVEHLVAERREQIPVQAYLYWFDGDDKNDPWMVIGPNGEEWRRGDPAQEPQTEKVEARHQPDHDEASSSAGEGFPASMENPWERGRSAEISRHSGTLYAGADPSR